MKMLLPLASLLGVEVESLVERIKKNAVALGAVAIFSLIALTFLIIAANNAMTAWLGPIWGPLAAAGTALLIALLIYGTVKTAAHNRKRREIRRRRSADTTALVTTAALTAGPMLLRNPMVRKLGIPLGGAIAAYLLLTRNSGSAHRDGYDPYEDE
ncbi:hypothetical protein EMQ25_02785 [Arsenicitalea aurantiaca]|uniref:Phage holin family protein n=1 Tax=Arsenicitalea aurantiaca TaxID=1783274 RepID=A0A433XLE0_9HYPH|nr:hypothetical protein [Arsenicitalea aurantiaca]RUT34899.1 hypothetical protein EMQ25_02785 [Arsenicitalea aurantiaca]